MQFQFCPSVKRCDKSNKSIDQAKAVNRLIFLKWVSCAVVMIIEFLIYWVLAIFKSLIRAEKLLGF